MGWVLGVGILLRMVLAVWRTDEVWPDSHFASLEPASKIVFGRALLAWEWQEGYKSWTLPLVYSPVLFLCKLLGFYGGLVPIYAGRLFTAIVSGIALVRFQKILWILRLRPGARFVTSALFALVPPMVLWGVSALADLWVMVVWVAVLPSIYRLTSEHSDRAWLKLGLWSGLSILFKLQSGLFALALGLGFLVQRKTFRQLVFYSLGVLTHLLVLGGLDWIAYGVPFSALIQQISKGEVISRFYGVAPWFDYFPQLVADQGIWFPFALAVAPGVVLIRWRSAQRMIQDRGQLLWMIFGPALFYFAFHSCVPHKETRFLLPILPALYLWVGLGLHFFAGWVGLRRLPHRFRGLVWASPVVIIALGVVSLFTVCTVPIYLTTVNIASLEAQVYRLQSASGAGSSCLLLMDHNWSWTRGQLILGDGVEVIEKKVSEFSPDRDAECFYAILPESKLPLFRRRSASGAWSLVDRSESAYVLLQKFQAY